MCNIKLSILASCVLVLLLITGCASTGSRRSSEGSEIPEALEVSTLLKFQDVPVPHGFRVVPNESFVFDNDITRIGILKYTGAANPSKLIEFYKDQMPLYNWRFVNVIEFGKRIMNFDRDDQTCTIIIEPGRLRNALFIGIAPKSGTASTYRVEEAEED